MCLATISLGESQGMIIFLFFLQVILRDGIYHPYKFVSNLFFIWQVYTRWYNDDMENLYTIKSVEISCRSVKGDKTSFTPNHWANSEFTFENLNVVVQKTLDLITERYGKDFFQKLVVTMTYSPVGTNLQHCIQSGHDEEGKIYCS